MAVSRSESFSFISILILLIMSVLSVIGIMAGIGVLPNWLLPV
jgi:hypothetical protein